MYEDGLRTPVIRPYAKATRSRVDETEGFGFIEIVVLHHHRSREGLQIERCEVGYRTDLGMGHQTLSNPAILRRRIVVDLRRESTAFELRIVAVRPRGSCQRSESGCARP